MLQGANSTDKAVAKTKLANIKSKNARASLANITMLFPPDTTWRRGWSYVQQALIKSVLECKTGNQTKTMQVGGIESLRKQNSLAYFRFFSSNLFLWRHFEISSDLLFHRDFW